LKTLTNTAPKSVKLPSGLKSLGITLTIPAQKKCVVARCFTNKNVFCKRDSDFDSLLPKTLTASGEVKAMAYNLTETIREAELVKIGKHFTNLSQIKDLILRTERGENTGLSKQVDSNVFFLEVGGSVFTVEAYRVYNGWWMNCFRFDRRRAWYAWSFLFSFIV